jgi:hypothetical protein
MYDFEFDWRREDSPMTEDMNERNAEQDVTNAVAEKPKSKTADKPHHISFVLSILAIVISGLSWWESHSNRLLNEEINRPVLSLGSIESRYGETLRSGETVILFDVGLKNSGKFTARIDKYVIESVHLNSGLGCLPKSTLGEPIEKIPSMPTWHEILPGQEEHFLGKATISPECAKLPILEFLVDVSVSYVDTTGKTYLQNFLQHVNMTLKPKK